MQARTPFVVLFLDRSGSSHLCSLLDSHPQISCGAEEFTIRKKESHGNDLPVREIHARRTEIIDPSPQQTIQHLESIFSRSRWAAGFKYKYPLQLQRFPEVFEWLVGRKSDVRVIHLDRKNLLRKAVSRQILEQLRRHPAFRRDRAELLFSAVTMDVDDLLGQLHRARNQRQELQQLASQFHHCLSIEYDDLHRNAADVGRRLETFLEVEVGHPLRSRFRKVTPERLSDAIQNFPEVAAAIRKSEFAEMLDD